MTLTLTTPRPSLPSLLCLSMSVSTTLLLFLATTTTTTLIVAQRDVAGGNPFLIQKAERLELQRLQQDRSASARRSSPKGGKPHPHHPPHAPLHPPDTSFGGQGVEESGGQNRNEMHGHKGRGPGPTPWTRWTPRPKYNHSPWKGRGKGSNNVCGARTYSAREHICCQKTLQKRQGLRPACCGTFSFDFVFSLCCDGNVTPRTAGRPFC